ncbi:MAG: ATP-dependent helicase [Patescibacteria group bacterium]|nr:ATP-dependent helicase [Patescibacteria group bacterium]MDE2438292.1 ATP-dependent helicase [Patescibacteria group bacterium]
MKNIVFQKEYEKLNTKQRKAVDAIEGPVVVFAGPGTGKTKVLTLRIANILKCTDTAPSSILALTFTDAAAANMRKRLFDVVGSAAYGVRIATFHKFCNDLIQAYPESFPRIIGATHITEAEQFEYIEEIVAHAPLSLLRPAGDPLYYARGIIRALAELKREGVTEDVFATQTAKEKEVFLSRDDLYHTKGAHKGKMKSEYVKQEHALEKNRELGIVYAEYEQMLQERKRYDYNDMILEVVRALALDSNLLLMLQEQYHYVLADEHQDVNNAQNTLLDLLVNYDPHPNIFIVGDAKQAIFRFQGASLQNFLYFLEKYPHAKAITLEDNYRSTQKILDAAHSLITKGEGDNDLNHELRAARQGTGKQVEIHAYYSPEDEYYFLGYDIRESLDHGVSPESIAVLYRDNNDVVAVAHVFEKMRIPFSIQSDHNVLDDLDVKNLLVVLKAIHYFGEGEWAARALHLPYFGIHPLDVYRVIVTAHNTRDGIYGVLARLSREDDPMYESRDALLSWGRNMRAWAESAERISASELCENVIRDSGLLGFILARPDAAAKLSKIKVLFQEIERLEEGNPGCRLRDLIHYLDVVEAHNLVIKGAKNGAHTGGVRGMTVHKAKGLEFDYVYMIGVTDGHWGNRRNREQFSVSRAGVGEQEREGNRNDDERHIFYVALTRAAKRLVISYATHTADGAEMLPSQFIGEIDPTHKETIDCTAHHASESSEVSELLCTPRMVTPESIYEKKFIAQCFEERGISPTALNHYRECPWKYFYSDLLRIPRAKVPIALYGIAAHAAMNMLFMRLRKGDPVTPEMVLGAFEYELGKTSLSGEQYQDFLVRGKDALRGYYEYYKNTWNINVLTEFFVEGATLSVSDEFTPVKLAGRIDKVELGVGNGVNVVDYKTKKPMSRNAIEGLTKDGNGDYKRQLVFYKLLLDRYEQGRYRMTSGEIDFLEPNERGIYKKECFDITEEDVRGLEEEIKHMATDVLHLSFWDVRCEEKDCEYCTLRDMIQ